MSSDDDNEAVEKISEIGMSVVILAKFIILIIELLR